MENRGWNTGDRDSLTQFLDACLVTFVAWLQTMPRQLQHPAVQAKEQAKAAGRHVGNGAFGVGLAVLIAGRLLARSRRSHSRPSAR